jgi:hypothetical protein
VKQEGSDLQASYNRAQEVKKAHQKELLAKENVVGVGIGFRNNPDNNISEVMIVVMVNSKVPRHMLASVDLVPEEIDGIPVDVEAVGEFSPHA